MRPLGRLSLILVVSLATIGCGGESMQEGIPKDVDLSKTYTPPAALPKMFGKAAARSRPKVAEDAPVDAPADTNK